MIYSLNYKKVCFIFTNKGARTNDNSFVYFQDKKVLSLASFHSSVKSPRRSRPTEIKNKLAIGKNVKVFYMCYLAYPSSKDSLVFYNLDQIAACAKDPKQDVNKNRFSLTVPSGSIQAFDFMYKGAFKFDYIIILTDEGCLYKFEARVQSPMISSMIPDQLTGETVFLDSIVVDQSVVSVGYCSRLKQSVYVMMNAELEFQSRLTLKEDSRPQ